MKKVSSSITSMRTLRRLMAMIVATVCLSAVHAAAPETEQQPTKKTMTTAEVLAASTPADWRMIDPQNTIYMELPAGRVIIELAPQFAPHYVANVIVLAQQGYFNGLRVE